MNGDKNKPVRIAFKSSGLLVCLFVIFFLFLIDVLVFQTFLLGFSSIGVIGGWGIAHYWRQRTSACFIISVAMVLGLFISIWGLLNRTD